MVLSLSEKSNIRTKYARHERDTGSPEFQVATFTARINFLQGHFEIHKKDHNSRRGLLKLVGKRRRALDYLKRIDIMRYRQLIAALEIRK